MTSQQQPRRAKVSKKATGSKSSQTIQSLPKSEGDTPMSKFNSAMRKILSVPKKKIK